MSERFSRILGVIGVVAGLGLHWYSIRLQQEQVDLARDQIRIALQQTQSAPGRAAAASHPSSKPIFGEGQMTPSLINLISSIILVVGLLVATGRFKVISILLKRLKKTAPTRSGDFQIIKADWGNAHTTKSVADIITSMLPNALTFFVNPDTFRAYDPDRADPAPGDDKKYVKITYSYPGRPDATVTRFQGQWVVMPEDPYLKAENQTLLEQVAQLEKECSALRLKMPKRDDKELIKNAPRLFIEHKHNPDNKRDVLLLRNDKDEEARYARFDPINALVRHRIVPTCAMPPIVGGGPQQECPVVVYNGATDNPEPLYEVLSEDPNNALETVRVYYSDGSGHQFYREFALKHQQQTQTVTWEPGPVCLVKTSEEGEP